MSNYKEIVTKAVLGKAKKKSINNFTVTPNETPSTILGCWLINHKYMGHNNNGVVNVNGSYDINVWYAYDNNKKTAVANYTFNYNDLLNMNVKNNLKISNDDEIVIKALKQPTVSNVEIKDDKVVIDVEKELGVEVVGETLVKINVMDDYDEYEELVDEIDDNTLENIEAVNTEFLD